MNVDSKDFTSWIPLLRAASIGKYDSHLATKEMLLKKGANVNAQNDIGSTPLHNITFGDNQKTMKLLLDHKADINKPDDYDRIPLFMAVQHNNFEAVQLLVEVGSNVNHVAYRSTLARGVRKWR